MGTIGLVGTVPQVVGTVPHMCGDCSPAGTSNGDCVGTVPHELEGLWGLFPARGDCTRILAEQPAPVSNSSPL